MTPAEIFVACSQSNRFLDYFPFQEKSRMSVCGGGRIELRPNLSPPDYRAALRDGFTGCFSTAICSLWFHISHAAEKDCPGNSGTKQEVPFTKPGKMAFLVVPCRKPTDFKSRGERRRISFLLRPKYGAAEECSFGSNPPLHLSSLGSENWEIKSFHPSRLR